MSEEQRPVDRIVNVAIVAAGSLKQAGGRVNEAHQAVSRAKGRGFLLGLSTIGDKLAKAEGKLHGMTEFIGFAGTMTAGVQSTAKEVAYSAADLADALKSIKDAGRDVAHVLRVVQQVVDDLPVLEAELTEMLSSKKGLVNVVAEKIRDAEGSATDARDELQKLLGVTEDGADAVDEATR